ncbi:MAG: DUF882 domain-containing protein [Burkholderiaceae bacterium]
MSSNNPTIPTRRRFLHHSARLAAASALPALSTPARALVPGVRALAFVHTHTQERIDLVYARHEHYVPAALGSLNHFLRDHYTGEVGAIDPRMFDLLHQVHTALAAKHPFEVISAYRCAATNTKLRQARGGGVARHSLHLEGRAIDVRLTGVALADLRDAALLLRAGGVGFYPREQFVHIDTGRVRSW